jgi:peptide/nickel transport system permease protein
MARYAVLRLAGALTTLFVGAVVAFGVFHLLPGDIAAVIGGPGATQTQLHAIRHNLGLDQGVVPQFFDWLGGVVQGDLGVSLISNVPVSELFAQRLPVTLELILTSLVVALVTSLPLSLGGLRPGSLLDRAAGAWAIVWLSIPIFWLGVLLALLFGVKLALLPTSGYVSFVHDPLQALRFALLPSITLGFYMSAMLTQFLRTSLAATMREDFIRTARAKGLLERQVVIGHAAKPALIPFVTILGILVGTAVGGTIIVEAVFDYPGFGRLFVDSIVKRDYYVVQDGILIVVAAVIVANLLVDLAYGLLDPRIRYGRR